MKEIYKLSDYEGITAELMMITPKMAAEMLTRNNINRPIQTRDVRKLAADIKAGRWEVNGDTIRFTESGELKDGQHRLSAIVLANTPTPTFVVKGLREDASMIDLNRIRTYANVLTMKGMSPKVANRRTIAVAKALLKLYGEDHTTVAHVEKLLDGKAENIIRTVAFMGRGSSHPICDKAIVGASIFCALENDLPAEKIERFTEVVNSGFSSGDKETAAIVFRNYLLNGFEHNHANKSAHEAALEQCTRAIKDFCDEKPRRAIYKGGPLFFDKVRDYIKSEIMEGDA